MTELKIFSAAQLCREEVLMKLLLRSFLVKRDRSKNDIDYTGNQIDSCGFRVPTEGIEDISPV